MSETDKKNVKPPRLTVSSDIGMGEYSNFVSIAHNYSEVLLDFGRTLPAREDIPVVSRIIMSPFQAKQLLRALTHNIQMYERTFGPIADPPQAAAAGTSETN
jgi:hypothetical protein